MAAEGSSNMLFGPFGGKSEKCRRFGELKGIEAFYSTNFIKSIEFKLDPNTSTTVQLGRNDGQTPFKVKLKPGEHITHFLGYFDKVKVGEGRERTAITFLTFETNEGRTLGPIGTERGKPFSVLPAAGTINEFFVGVTYEEDCLTSFGARVELRSADSQTVKENSVKSIGPFGGGRHWDDGIFTRVKEIHLGLTTDKVIRSIRLVYDFGDKKKVEVLHRAEVSSQEEKINEEKVPLKSNEYLTSIAGHVRDDGFIQALEFYTNLNRHKYGDSKGGKYFWYPSTGENKIVGFHGTWGETLNSIGTYVKPISPLPPLKKFKPFPDGSGGDEWKDGKRSHVIGYRVTTIEDKKKIKDNKKIESITFMYDDNGSLVQGERHGGGEPESGTWTRLNFPEERLISLEGYWRKEDGTTIIHNLQLFTTDGSRPTRVYANNLRRKEELELKKALKNLSNKESNELDELKEKFEESTRFQIPEKEGRRISGFFGRASNKCLHSIGAYVGSY